MTTTRAQAEALATFVRDLALPDEDWRPVVGYESTYLVSSLGRVLSIPRPTTSGGILRQGRDRYGYPKVSLVQGGTQRKIKVHKLVAEAFIGPRPVGMEVRHLDGSRDACATNLAYGTHAENMQDMVRHGVRRHPLRTECRKGHSLDGDNAYEHRGRLHCRTCRHEQYLSRVGRSQ